MGCKSASFIDGSIESTATVSAPKLIAFKLRQHQRNNNTRKADQWSGGEVRWVVTVRWSTMTYVYYFFDSTFVQPRTSKQGDFCKSICIYTYLLIWSVWVPLLVVPWCVAAAIMSQAVVRWMNGLKKIKTPERGLLHPITGERWSNPRNRRCVFFTILSISSEERISQQIWILKPFIFFLNRILYIPLLAKAKINRFVAEKFIDELSWLLHPSIHSAERCYNDCLEGTFFISFLFPLADKWLTHKWAG